MGLLTKVAKGVAFGDVSNQAVRNILTEISKSIGGDFKEEDMEKTLEYFGWRCPYTDEDLRPLIAKGNGYATDHIYPQNRTWCGLNVKGNLIIVTKRANDVKHNQDVETFLLNDTKVLGTLDMPTRMKRLQKIKSFQMQNNYDPDKIRKIVSPLMEARYEEIRKEQEKCISDTLAELGNNGIHPVEKTAAPVKVKKQAGAVSSSRDYSKYFFNTQEYTKGALLVALVEKYLQDNPCADAKELKEKFDLKLVFGNKPIILLYTDVPKSWAEKVYARRLSDGTIVYINKQVQVDDMPEILRITHELGYKVVKV